MPKIISHILLAKQEFKLEFKLKPDIPDTLFSFYFVWDYWDQPKLDQNSIVSRYFASYLRETSLSRAAVPSHIETEVS